MSSLLSLSIVLLTSFHQAFAANCYGGSGIDPDASSAWQLRDQVCGHNICAGSDAAYGNNHFCSIFLPFANGQAVQIQRSDPTGQFTNWYVQLPSLSKICSTY